MARTRPNMDAQERGRALRAQPAAPPARIIYLQLLLLLLLLPVDTVQCVVAKPHTHTHTLDYQFQGQPIVVVSHSSLGHDKYRSL